MAPPNVPARHEAIEPCDITDAVFSKIPLVLNEGDELGQWELEEVSDLLTVQSGVYSYTKNDKIENKTRGFATGSVATMGIVRDPAEFPEREARDIGKLGGGEEAIDLEAIENRLALEGVSDKKLKMVSFREALLNKVSDAWRQAVFNPDGSVNLSPEIVLMLRTFKTAGAAVASRDQFDLIGRWANVPKRLAVHTPVADTGGLRRRRGVTRVAVNTIREVMSPLERLTLIPGKDEPPA